MKTLRWILILCGGLLALDTLIVARVSNFNLGVILPAVLGVPLFVVGLCWEPLSAWCKKGLGRVAKWLFWGGYATFVLMFAITLALILRAGLAVPAPGADAVIVLGAGIRGTTVTRTLATRLNAAAGYLERNPEALVIVSGGQGPGEDITEAQAMAGYLERRGVDPARIIKEEKATSTQENFSYSKAILEEIFGPDAQAVFVTNAFHVFRAGLTARREGMNAAGLGCPDTWYLLPNNYLREACAIWVYWITGRF